MTRRPPRLTVTDTLVPAARLFRANVVDPGAIETVRLLTVEGDQDDISAPGQTDAAHRLCRNIPDSMRGRHLQEGAGHYGVFSGSSPRSRVLPQPSGSASCPEREWRDVEI